MTSDDVGLRGLTGSARFRITAVATLVVVAVLVVASAALVAVHRRLLTEDLDERLVEAAQTIEQAIDAGAVPAVLGGFGDDDSAAQVVSHQGVVLASTPNLRGEPPISTP